MIVFSCHVCQTKLSAEEQQAGMLVRCPTCHATLRAPMPANSAVPVGAGAPASAAAQAGFAPPARSPAIGTMGGFPSARGGGRRYGFNCGYCSSRLEANESMAAQEGQCPTCGNNIVIPILDRYGRLIDPITKKIIKQDPHPVHAYAAAGDRAPRIIRRPDGKQTIICPRCSAASPITANNCKSCGMPFTMEGTTLEAAGASNGFCVASLVLGIIGIPSFMCFAIMSILAVIFGSIGLVQANKSGQSGGRGMAVAGLILGALGILFYLYWLMTRM